MLAQSSIFLGKWTALFAGVSDPRHPNLIIYPLVSLLFTGTLLFICRLGSRRGVNDKLRQNEPSQAKFAAWFGIETIPHGDTLNYGYQRLKVDEVQEVVCRSVETLIRKKVLYRFRLLGVYFLVAIDGTGVLTFRERHCPQCLTKKMHNGDTIYYHPVLEAKLVTSNGFAFSIMTAFAANAVHREQRLIRRQTGLRTESVLSAGETAQETLSALTDLLVAGWVVCWRTHLPTMCGL